MSEKPAAWEVTDLQSQTSRITTTYTHITNRSCLKPFSSKKIYIYTPPRSIPIHHQIIPIVTPSGHSTSPNIFSRDVWHWSVKSPAHTLPLLHSPVSISKSTSWCMASFNFHHQQRECSLQRNIISVSPHARYIVLRFPIPNCSELKAQFLQWGLLLGISN